MFQIIETLIFSFIGIIVGIAGTLMIQTASMEIPTRSVLDISVGIIIGMIAMLLFKLAGF